MHTGVIDTSTEQGALRLSETLESGQTFCWRRDRGHGEMFDDADSPRYYTVIPEADSPTGNPELLRVCQPETVDGLSWEATFPAESVLRRRLRLNEDLSAIQASLPDDDVLEDAFDAHYGLRVPNDSLFPCLVSFICSSQMRVSRIHEMQVNLSREFGQSVSVEGNEYYAFPTPEQLATAEEDALRELNLGYRAGWVKRTAKMLSDGDVSLDEIPSQPYESAKSELEECVGVGDKVADCVLLYAGGFLDVVPIDTWIQSGMDDHYPGLVGDSYDETSQNLRDYFGNYAGYAQSYLFHHLRTQ